MNTTNIETVESLFYTMWNQQQIELANELFADSFTIHYGEQIIDDIEIFKHLLQDWFIGIPDLQHELLDCFSHYNKVVTRWVGKGTHSGTFIDIAATGEAFVYSGISLFEMNLEHRISKVWVYNDLTDVLLKLQATANKT